MLLFTGFFLYGCLFQQQQTPTTPAPTVTPKPAQQTTASPPPVPTPNATATASATPSAAAATPTPKPECTIGVNPNNAQGPFRAGVSATFFNLANPGNVTIKCSADDAGVVGEKSGDSFFRVCDYSYTLSRKIVVASASAQGVSCNTTAVIEANPDYTKNWVFAPDGESFTMNKTQSNTTTRNYTISNTGGLDIASFSCTADKSFATIKCPTAIAKGESQPMNATFSVSGQPAGQQSVLLTIKEKDLEKTMSVSVNIVT